MSSSVCSPLRRLLLGLASANIGVQIKTITFTVLFSLWSFALLAASYNPLPGDSSLVANICADEFYVFNGDTLNQPGTYSATYIASDGSDSTVTLSLNIFPLYSDSFSVSVCAGDYYEFQGTQLTSPGVYSVVLTSSAGCDSIITVSLSVLPVYQTFTEAGICSGSSYFFHGETLGATGTYGATLTAENGCDSLIVLDLQVVDYFDIVLNERICSGGSYLFGDTLLTQSGIYVDSLLATGGCDSIVTLHLQVLPPVSVHLFAGVCTGYSYVFRGDTLTQPGDYIYQTTTGCDSIITLTLQVGDYLETSVSAAICQGEAYNFNGQLLTTEGIYTDSLQAFGGCDSVVILNLSILPALITQFDVNICPGESFFFEGVDITDPGVYTSVYSGENGCDSTVILNLAYYPAGSDTVVAVICEGESYDLYGQIFNQTGVYTFIYSTQYGCEATVTLLLTVRQPSSTEEIVTICQGELYFYGGQVLSQSGDYNFLLEDTYGCDSLVTLHLDVRPVTQTSVNVDICQGELYNLGGIDYANSGIYLITLSSSYGCDSLIVLRLTVLPDIKRILQKQICHGETFEFEGQTLASDGVYTATYQAYNGCDSIISLFLTVLPSFQIDLDASICQGESYLFEGDTISQSGFYTKTYQAVNGCDSVRTLTLAVLPLTSSSVSVTICTGESYTFNGENLTDSGTYTATLTGQNGCDSVATLVLSVLPVSQTNIDVTVCANEGYPFAGQLLTQSGVYSLTLQSENGCDSLITINLTVLPVYNTLFETSICSGDPYWFVDTFLTASGTYQVTYQSQSGCDSVITLVLQVLPDAVDSQAVFTCHGEPYIFAGDTLSQSGAYVYAYPNGAANGCDSVYVVNLTVSAPSAVTISAAVCEGGAYTFNGENLTASGTYTAVLTGQYGCDSVVTLLLSVLPVSKTDISATVCAGEGYPFAGQLLTQSGVYNLTLQAENGCDSIVILQLSVIPAASSATSVTLCPGESYNYGGEVLTNPGVYTFVFTSALGCDSVVTLTLIYQQPPVLLVTSSGSTLSVLGGQEPFQWINCANNEFIPGATGSSFTPVQSGSYAVISTSSAGCTSVSNCVNVIISSTDDLSETESWSLSPNPTSGAAIIRWSEATRSESRLEVTDASGRLIYSQKVPAGSDQAEFDLVEYPSGIFNVRIISGTGVFTKKLVKTRI